MKVLKMRTHIRRLDLYTVSYARITWLYAHPCRWGTVNTNDWCIIYICTGTLCVTMVASAISN